MSRRRPVPWIHRWSRHLIGAVALIGALGTAYLTVVKLTGGSAACPTSGCEQVLSSPYATVFGLPLTLLGFLAYASMGMMAIVPLVISSDTQKEARSKLESWTWLLLFSGAVAMVVFSAYLMYLLAFKIQALCLYCLASALLTVTLLVLTVIGRNWRDIGQLFFTAIVVGMIALIATLGVYAQASNPITAISGGSSPGIEVTTDSGPAEIALAKHLKQVGAKMYGAWWCPHCNDQKQLFGKAALSEFTYIECDPRGANAQPKVCQAAKVESYPTWEIKGKTYTGTQSLKDLAAASGYQGPDNFKNTIVPAS